MTSTWRPTCCVALSEDRSEQCGGWNAASSSPRAMRLDLRRRIATRSEDHRYLSANQIHDQRRHTFELRQLTARSCWSWKHRQVLGRA